MNFIDKIYNDEHEYDLGFINDEGIYYVCVTNRKYLVCSFSNYEIIREGSMSEKEFRQKYSARDTFFSTPILFNIINNLEVWEKFCTFEETKNN